MAALDMLARQTDRSLEFYIFGHPVHLSPSPDIHQVGFSEHGLKHKYGRFDAPEWQDCLAKLREEGCGGGSVTIPHKEVLLKEMDELSEAASTIGALNTVTKLADGRLYGDNTDWLGIKNNLEARLAATRNGDWERQRGDLTCFLGGSGGTARAAAFALKKMGARRVLIYNRTAERAEQLAKEFGFEACPDLAALSQLDRLDLVVNTLPGSTGFTLPDASVLARHRPVVFEAAYIPRRTAFLAQALDAGCEIVEGVEMLFEQGCAQCEIWTGKKPPRAKIAGNLVKELFTEGSDHPAFPKMEPYDRLPVSLAIAVGRSLKRGPAEDFGDDDGGQSPTKTPTLA